MPVIFHAEMAPNRHPPRDEIDAKKEGLTLMTSFVKKHQEIVTDVLVRRDRGNQGLGTAAAVDILETMIPSESREQLSMLFRCTVWPAVSARLTGPVVAQATATKRTAITVQQQWRWHTVSPSGLVFIVTCF